MRMRLSDLIDILENKSEVMSRRIMEKYKITKEDLSKIQKALRNYAFLIEKHPL